MHAGMDAPADEDGQDEAGGIDAGIRMQRQDRLNRNTSLIMQRAIEETHGIHDSAEGATQTPKQLLAEVADVCRRVNATIARQSADRTRGRFFGPEVVDAAMMEPVDADYMSDEDTIAVYIKYDDGSDAVEIGLAERLMRARQAGSLVPYENANQLSINDPRGIVRVRWFEAAMPPRGRQEQLRHEGEQLYALSLRPKEGLNFKVTCAQIIHGVWMKWHEARNLYSLSSADETALGEWLSDVRAAGSTVAVPSRANRRRTSRADKRAQKAQRRPGLRSAGPVAG